MALFLVQEMVERIKNDFLRHNIWSSQPGSDFGLGILPLYFLISANDNNGSNSCVVVAECGNAY